MSDDEIQQLKKTEVKQETIQERMKRQKQERREELVYTQEDEDRWARNRERVISEQNTIEVPSFDLDKALKNPELDGIKPLNIDPVSMAVKTVVDLIEGGKEFIANPSLGGVAAMAVTAIPGKYADKVLESNYSPVALRDLNAYRVNMEGIALIGLNFRVLSTYQAMVENLKRIGMKIF